MLEGPNPRNSGLLRADSILRRKFCKVVLPAVTGSGTARKRTLRRLHLRVLLLKFGRLPERPKGADCKSAGNAYGGSNPSSATQGKASGTTGSGGFFVFASPPPSRWRSTRQPATTSCTQSGNPPSRPAPNRGTCHHVWG